MKSFLSKFIVFLIIIALSAANVAANAPIIVLADEPNFTLMPTASQALKAIEENQTYIPKTVQSVSSVNSYTGYRRSVTLPEKYDSRELGIIPSVKNQGTTSLCWAFTQTDIIETKLIKDSPDSLSADTYNFSEYHMAQATSYYSYFSNENIYGFLRSPFDGGNEVVSTGYLTRGAGLVLESDDPMRLTYSRDISITDSKPTIGYINNAKFYDFVTIESNQNIAIKNQEVFNKVKRLIYENGAVGSSTYFPDGSYFPYYNYSNNSYYYNGSVEYQNHSVTIIGWDDSYSKYNFSNTPPQNGAFIVKSSWGDNILDQGYFYCSYYDKFITNSIYTTDYSLEKAPYNNIYQYDYHGWTSLLMSSSNDIYYSAKFTVSSIGEVINSIGTYIPAENTSIEILVNRNGGKIESLTDFISVYKGIFSDSGYYRVDVSPVTINSKEFVVMIKSSSTLNTKQTYIPIQASVEGFTKGVVANKPNTCYIGTDITSMTAIENILPDDDAMICLKAYTVSDISITAPRSELISIEGDNVYITASPPVTSLALLAEGKSLQSWELYSDISCTKITADKIATFTGANTTVYMKLNFTQSEKIYTVNITHRTIGIESKILAVEDGVVNDQKKEVYVTAPDNALSFDLVITTASNASVKVYGNAACTSDKSSSIQINQKTTKVYAKVISEDKNSSTIYKIIIISPRSPVTFSDQNAIASWAKPHILTISNEGIMVGNSTGNFQPKKNITRNEIAVIAAKVVGLDCGKFSYIDLSDAFNDEIADWAQPYVKAAYAMNIMNGKPSGNNVIFSGGSNTSRQEFAVITCAIIELEGAIDSYNNAAIDAKWTSMGFVDSDTVPDWSLPYLKKAVYLELISGHLSNNKYYVYCAKPITRQESAVVIANTIKLINN